MDGKLKQEEQRIDLKVLHHLNRDDHRKKLKRFRRTVAAVHAIVSNKLYRSKASSLEAYFREAWKISRAQVYRFLDCAAVLKQLAGFTEQPCRERLCRSLKRLAKNRQDTRKLWECVLAKVNNDHESVTSTIITNVWQQLVEAGEVTGQPEAPGAGGAAAGGSTVAGGGDVELVLSDMERDDNDEEDDSEDEEEAAKRGGPSGATSAAAASKIPAAEPGLGGKLREEGSRPILPEGRASAFRPPPPAPLYDSAPYSSAAATLTRSKEMSSDTAARAAHPSDLAQGVSLPSSEWAITIPSNNMSTGRSPALWRNEPVTEQQQQQQQQQPYAGPQYPLRTFREAPSREWAQESGLRTLLDGSADLKGNSAGWDWSQQQQQQQPPPQHRQHHQQPMLQPFDMPGNELTAADVATCTAVLDNIHRKG
ncbi:hypothetical protein HK104_010889, partial [Borealophlyctis nickersoniae]